MKKIIAGYTCAPPHRRSESAYYRRLATTPHAEGVALAWQDASTAAQIGDILDVLPPDWTVALTAIAATYPAWLAAPAFGLASPDPDGREAATAMARQIAEGVRRINDRAGRAAVLAVEFQSAPGYGGHPLRPDAEAFRRSLTEIAALDWDGAALLVEHCDAPRPGRTPVKGFLTLRQEIDTVASLTGSGIGLSLNWGRSLLELRDPDRVHDHAAEAAASGLLRAFTLSGNGDRASTHGAAWDDTHLPFADTLDSRYAEPTSLLTTARAAQSLAHLHDPLFVAVKTGWPAERTDPAERAAAIRVNFATAVDVLRRSRPPGRP
ncbi:DUF4862 family protein [Kitasatospora sp. NPDC048365]|uniref:DUF4862 family protein n=1 Tax=Kitasatospora sp. NPDC048365 TaxID=3364050 RepID=UPI0037136217